MQKPTFDPGLTQQFSGVLRRSINKDGSFNVYRRGGSWRDFHPYLQMLNMSWPRFFATILSGYLLINLMFALVYFGLGPDHLHGADGASEMDRFLNDFFFSTHTLTTVGYGNIVPVTVTTNIVASLEAIVGLMLVALGTGLMFGRFSRPSARIAFSERILLAPYQEQTSLQFRIVNLRPNILMDLEANMVLMTVEGPPGQMKRQFQTLKLERERVYFLPLTWYESRIAQFIAVSPECNQQLAERIPFRAKDITTLPYGVRVPRRSNARSPRCHHDRATSSCSASSRAFRIRSSPRC